MNKPFVVLELFSRGLQAAITGLNGLNESPADKLEFRRQMDELGPKIAQDLANETPVKTGLMRDSWEYQPVREAKNEFLGKIINHAPHSRHVIRGSGMYDPTSPGMIVAQTGKPFRFVKEGKKFKLYQHAGQPPNPNIRAYIDSIIDIMKGATIRAAGRALRGLLTIGLRRGRGTSPMGASEVEDTAAELHPRDYVGYGSESVSTEDAVWLD